MTAEGDKIPMEQVNFPLLFAFWSLLSRIAIEIWPIVDGIQSGRKEKSKRTQDIALSQAIMLFIFCFLFIALCFFAFCVLLSFFFAFGFAPRTETVSAAPAQSSKYRNLST